MNEFTELQRETIRVLASTYFDVKMKPIEGMEAIHEWHKQTYVEQITKGLTDPDYWG